jgi:hypothetical protein
MSSAHFDSLSVGYAEIGLTSVNQEQAGLLNVLTTLTADSISSNNLTVVGPVGIAGTSTFNGLSNFNNNVNFNGSVLFGGSLTVAALTTTGLLTAEAGASVTGGLETDTINCTGHLTVRDGAGVLGTVSCDNLNTTGEAVIGGALTVNSDATVAGSLSVSSNNITFNAAGLNPVFPIGIATSSSSPGLVVVETILSGVSGPGGQITAAEGAIFDTPYISAPPFTVPVVFLQGIDPVNQAVITLVSASTTDFVANAFINGVPTAGVPWIASAKGFKN